MKRRRHVPYIYAIFVLGQNASSVSFNAVQPHTFPDRVTKPRGTHKNSYAYRIIYQVPGNTVSCIDRVYSIRQYQVGIHSLANKTKIHSEDYKNLIVVKHQLIAVKSNGLLYAGNPSDDKTSPTAAGYWCIVVGYNARFCLYIFPCVATPTTLTPQGASAHIVWY